MTEAICKLLFDSSSDSEEEFALRTYLLGKFANLNCASYLTFPLLKIFSSPEIDRQWKEEKVHQIASKVCQLICLTREKNV